MIYYNYDYTFISAVHVWQGDKYAAFLHDAVILYAIALNRTYAKGEDVNSGVVVAKNCRGVTFRGHIDW